MLPGSDAMRTAWAAHSFEAGGGLWAGGAGARGGGVNVLIDRLGGDFGGERTVLAIAGPQGSKISATVLGKEKMGNSEVRRGARLPTDRFCPRRVLGVVSGKRAPPGVQISSGYVSRTIDCANTVPTQYCIEAESRCLSICSYVLPRH
jgi:hypothetical protein